MSITRSIRIGFGLRGTCLLAWSLSGAVLATGVPDRSVTRVATSVSLAGTNLRGRVCAVLLAAYGADPSHAGLHDPKLPVFLVEEGYASSSGADEPTPLDAVGARLAHDLLRARGRDFQPVSKKSGSYRQLNSAVFAARVDNREYRVTVRPRDLPPRMLNHDGIFEEFPAARSWVWMADGYFDLWPELVSASDQSPHVERFKNRRHAEQMIPPDVFKSLTSYVLEDEILGLPHHLAGQRWSRADEKNEGFELNYGSYRFYLVLHPSQRFPIGYLVTQQLVANDFGDEQLGFLRGHFSPMSQATLSQLVSTFRYTAHFDLEGRRVEAWREEALRAIPLGRHIPEGTKEIEPPLYSGLPLRSPHRTLPWETPSAQASPDLVRIRDPLKGLRAEDPEFLSRSERVEGWKKPVLGAVGIGGSENVGNWLTVGGMESDAAPIFSPSGRYAWYFYPHIHLIDLQTGKRIGNFDHLPRVEAASYSPGGAEVALAHHGGWIQILDAATGNKKDQFRLPQIEEIGAVTWIDDGHWVIVRRGLNQNSVHLVRRSDRSMIAIASDALLRNVDANHIYLAHPDGEIRAQPFVRTGGEIRLEKSYRIALGHQLDRPDDTLAFTDLSRSQDHFIEWNRTRASHSVVRHLHDAQYLKIPTPFFHDKTIGAASDTDEQGRSVVVLNQANGLFRVFWFPEDFAAVHLEPTTSKAVRIRGLKAVALSTDGKLMVGAKKNQLFFWSLPRPGEMVELSSVEVSNLTIESVRFSEDATSVLFLDGRERLGRVEIGRGSEQ